MAVLVVAKAAAATEEVKVMEELEAAAMAEAARVAAPVVLAVAKVVVGKAVAKVAAAKEEVKAEEELEAEEVLEAEEELEAEVAGNRSRVDGSQSSSLTHSTWPPGLRRSRPPGVAALVGQAACPKTASRIAEL